MTKSPRLSASIVISPDEYFSHGFVPPTLVVGNAVHLLAFCAVVAYALDSHLSPDQGECLVSFHPDGHLFGSCRDSSEHLIFVVPPHRGDYSHLATPSGRREFADALAIVMADLNRSEFTRETADRSFQSVLNALAVAADWQRRGNRRGNYPTVLRAIDPMAGRRVAIFKLPEHDPIAPPPAITVPTISAFGDDAFSDDSIFCTEWGTVPSGE